MAQFRTESHERLIAHFAALDKFLDFEIARLGAELKHAGENDFRILLVRRNQPFGIGFVSGDRFFDHRMDACIERGDTERCVLIVRRRDDDCVDEAGPDEFFAIREDFEWLELFQFAGNRIGHGDQFDTVDFTGGQIAMMMLADISHANDA